MKFLKANITTILIIAVAVLVTLLLVGMFRKTPVDNSYKEKLELKDSMLASLRRELVGEREAKDVAIRQLQVEDSLKQIRYNNNTKIIYEKIPVYIRSLNKDSLRAAGERAAN